EKTGKVYKYWGVGEKAIVQKDAANPNGKDYTKLVKPKGSRRVVYHPDCVELLTKAENQSYFQKPERKRKTRKQASKTRYLELVSGQEIPNDFRPLTVSTLGIGETDEKLDRLFRRWLESPDSKSIINTISQQTGVDTTTAYCQCLRKDESEGWRIHPEVMQDFSLWAASVVSKEPRPRDLGKATKADVTINPYITEWSSSDFRFLDACFYQAIPLRLYRNDVLRWLKEDWEAIAQLMDNLLSGGYSCGTEHDDVPFTLSDCIGFWETPFEQDCKYEAIVMFPMFLRRFEEWMGDTPVLLHDYDQNCRMHWRNGRVPYYPTENTGEVFDWWLDETKGQVRARKEMEDDPECELSVDYYEHFCTFDAATNQLILTRKQREELGLECDLGDKPKDPAEPEAESVAEVEICEESDDLEPDTYFEDLMDSIDVEPDEEVEESHESEEVPEDLRWKSVPYCHLQFSLLDKTKGDAVLPYYCSPQVLNNIPHAEIKARLANDRLTMTVQERWQRFLDSIPPGCEEYPDIAEEPDGLSVRELDVLVTEYEHDMLLDYERGWVA
ncbi:MAG: hypothetical protein F6K55_22405, partial [Moorea sp. SIO4A3]|nr:hypothetical protein [Moorena sp. SIO4A3]